MSRSRGIVGPPPEFPFVRCATCSSKRRVGRAVSICRTCDQALCELHLEACACPPWLQLRIGGVA